VINLVISLRNHFIITSFTFKWLLASTCVTTRYLREKLLVRMPHVNGFSSACWPLYAHPFLYTLHLKCLSPVCVQRCLIRTFLQVNALPHISYKKKFVTCMNTVVFHKGTKISQSSTINIYHISKASLQSEYAYVMQGGFYIKCFVTDVPFICLNSMNIT
jgi:hypothetical protein